jgi:hypothetical protein
LPLESDLRMLSLPQTPDSSSKQMNAPESSG